MTLAETVEFLLAEGCSPTDESAEQLIRDMKETPEKDFWDYPIIFGRSLRFKKETEEIVYFVSLKQMNINILISAKGDNHQRAVGVRELKGTLSRYNLQKITRKELKQRWEQHARTQFLRLKLPPKNSGK